MNLHKAKGLEASFVFLANPVGQREHMPDKHIIRKGMIAEGYFLCRKKSGLYQWTTLSHPVKWEEKVEEERLYAEAEERRLMYVASTRAKDCLVVSTYEGALGGRRAWSSLDDYIQGVPELEIPDVSIVKERQKLRLEKGEWEGAKERIKERRDVAAVPSYAVESVTSLAKKDLEVPEWRRGSYGMAWGRVVHKMLEIIAKWDQDLYGDGYGDSSGDTGADRYHRKIGLLAENFLVAEEITMEKKGELLSLIDSILKSDFWQRIMKAEKRYFEIPFSIKTDSTVLRLDKVKDVKNKKIAKKAKLPLILTGAIDLAFFEQDGWVIADYKTDEVGERLENFVKYYGSQVELYSKYWEEITKQKVKEAGLYFTSLDKWVKIYPES